MDPFGPFKHSHPNLIANLSTLLAMGPQPTPNKSLSLALPIINNNTNPFSNPYSPPSLLYSTLSPLTTSPLNNYPQLPIHEASGLNSLLLNLQRQQNMVFKAQMEQIMKMKSSLLEQLQQSQIPLELQSEMSYKFSTSPSDQENAITFLNRENSGFSTDKILPMPPPVRKMSSEVNNKDLKSQVINVVTFVLENFGRSNEKVFEQEKALYGENPDLVAVIDILIAKYSSTIKTREEIVKYTLRKAFKFVKNNIKKETNAGTREVCKAVCEKYFSTVEEEAVEIGNEKDLLKRVLPFRKNSKNKTMNISFIGEVFSSDNFCRDYEVYLENFDAILEEDNESKIERFASFIEKCIQKKNLNDISKYKRIPWPQLWIANTKKIALDLPNIGAQALQSPENFSKRLKSEST